jgi:hypothetical protein
MASANSYLQTASQHLQQALEHQTQGNHAQATKSISSAKAALEKASNTKPDPIANPTGAIGAQASNGQQPRAAAEEMATRLFKPRR